MSNVVSFNIVFIYIEIQMHTSLYGIMIYKKSYQIGSFEVVSILRKNVELDLYLLCNYFYKIKIEKS